MRTAAEDHRIRNWVQVRCMRLCLLGIWLCWHWIRLRRLWLLGVWHCSFRAGSCRLWLLDIRQCRFRIGPRRLWPAGDEDSRGVNFHILAVVPQWTKNRDTCALGESAKGCWLSTLADGDGAGVVHEDSLISVG